MKNLFFFLFTALLATGSLAQNAILINNDFTAGTYFSREEGMSIEACFALGDNIYAGIGEARYGNRNYFYKYSISENAWTKLNDFPGDQRRYCAISFSYNGKGYFGLGGYRQINSDIWEYDPASDTWALFADYPGGKVSGAAVFVIDNFAYIGSGAVSGDISTTDFWKLNLNTKEWTKIASIPGSLEKGCGFAIDGKGYIAGGIDEYYYTYSNKLLEYDPQSDTWTVKLTGSADFHYTYAKAGVVGKEAYIFYGDVCKVSKYNPATNTITSLTDFVGLNEERYSALCVTHGGNIYYGLGTYNESGFAQYPRDLWKLAVTTHIHELNAVNGFIYYNARSKTIQVNGYPVDKLEIFDLTGNRVLLSKQQNQVNISHLACNIYLVSVYSGGKYRTQKVKID